MCVCVCVFVKIGLIHMPYRLDTLKTIQAQHGCVCVCGFISLHQQHTCAILLLRATATILLVYSSDDDDKHNVRHKSITMCRIAIIFKKYFFFYYFAVVIQRSEMMDRTIWLDSVVYASRNHLYSSALSYLWERCAYILVGCDAM